jgi:hypothetical protein
MSGQTLFNGEVEVNFRFVNVHTAAGDLEFEVGEECRGQVNGLCGAAVPGLLNLMTGLHTGPVGFTVERHEGEPSIDDSWEEIVEVSFSTAADRLALHGFEKRYMFTLAPGDYRVRFCARGMDEGQVADTLTSGEPVDEYLLQFWPGLAAPDRILKQTSKAAAYWHHTRTLTPEQQAEVEQQEAVDRERMDRERWGDRVPNARLRAVDGLLHGFLERLDLDLVFALSEAEDDIHRAVACWSALRAAEVAGLIDLPVLAPAIAALRRGRPVPAPYDDPAYMWATIADAVPHTTVLRPPHGDREIGQQDWAIPALFATACHDSLKAALEALSAAAGAYGMEYPRLFAQLRLACPQLRT